MGILSATKVVGIIGLFIGIVLVVVSVTKNK